MPFSPLSESVVVVDSANDDIGSDYTLSQRVVSADKSQPTLGDGETNKFTRTHKHGHSVSQVLLSHLAGIELCAGF